MAALVVSSAVAAQSTPNAFIASMTPSQETHTPVVGATSPSCLATFELLSAGNRLRYKIDCYNISGVTAAHLHGFANADSNAGVLLGLFSGPATGAIDGRLVRGVIDRGVQLSEANYDALIAGMAADMVYVNVHTSVNPQGEVRGQVAGINVRRRAVIDVF